MLVQVIRLPLQSDWGNQLVTICFTYFKSLTLANLAASLYSIRRQNLTDVESIVVVDNDTLDSIQDIQAVIDQQAFPIPVQLFSFKHGDILRKQSWSTNVTVRLAKTPWVFYTRADYLLAFDIVEKFIALVKERPTWNGFITSNGIFLSNSVEDCEQTDWRQAGPIVLRGVEYDYTSIDSGVWMARRDAFESVGGFVEDLSAWGHAQTLFQWKMFKAGVEFLRIPEVLFWHPFHGAERDIDQAHKDLAELGGFDLHEMWARYHGVSPYAGLR